MSLTIVIVESSMRFPDVTHGLHVPAKLLSDRTIRADARAIFKVFILKRVLWFLFLVYDFCLSSEH